MKKNLVVFIALSLAMPLISAERVPVTLMSCRDLLCTNRTDTFLVNESAYIDYNSSIREISYSATLTFPDGTKYQITFPNRITSNATGNYTVEMTVWKEGYEETKLTKVVQFVERIPERRTENPYRVDIVPLITLVLSALIVFSLWKYSKRRQRQKGKRK
ncbi:MAG: hypothetical protein QXN71_03570 [Candidatus Aenigmatarchaeota archaeon]